MSTYAEEAETATMGIDPALSPHRPNDVVALVTSTDPWSPAATTGVALARQWGSRLTGCYVDPSLRTLSGADAEPTVLGLLIQAWDEDHGERAAFESLARASGVPDAAWAVTHTSVAPTLRQLGAWHDLAVLERDMVEGHALADILGETMLSCRIPCLILPPGWKGEVAFKRVLIAWNGSIESTRALHAALPFLEAAKDVILIDGERLNPEDLTGHPPRFDPITYLMRHRIAVKPHSIGGPHHLSGEKLLQEAVHLHADLLVMGAYGHSRTRERILGGATRHALQHAKIPLLMQH
ncbi:universal stress protein [Dyella koreensis]